MAKVGVTRAAELTGKSKSTIQRAMNNGKISFEMDKNDKKVIDTSELERVFGFAEKEPVQTGASVEAELQKAADMIEMERMRMRIKMLEHQNDALTGQVDDLKAQRDEWQKQAQQVLLTSQYSQKQAEDLKTEIKEREARARAKREQVLAERVERAKARKEALQREENLKNAQAANGFLARFKRKKAA